MPPAHLADLVVEVISMRVVVSKNAPLDLELAFSTLFCLCRGPWVTDMYLSTNVSNDTPILAFWTDENDGFVSNHLCSTATKSRQLSR